MELFFTFCFISESIKAKSKTRRLLGISSASQTGKGNCNFRGKLLDWHWICLVNCCKGHAKEGLQMSNSHLWSLSLCEIWWIDILFQTQKMSLLMFWCRMPFHFSDNGNRAFMGVCERHWFSDVNFWCVCMCVLADLLLCNGSGSVILSKYPWPFWPLVPFQTKKLNF